MAQKTTAEVKVRMPKDLHRKIQREADRKGQTINAEILVRLAESFDEARNARLAEAFDEARKLLESIKRKERVIPDETSIDELASRLAKRLENSFLTLEQVSNVWETWARQNYPEGAEAWIEGARRIEQQRALEQKREADEQTALLQRQAKELERRLTEQYVRTQEEEIERAAEELAARMGLPPNKFLSITVLDRLGPPVSSRTSDEDDFARRKKPSGVFQTLSTKGKSDD